MKKEYIYKNGTVYICNLDKLDVRKLHKTTELFLRRAMNERIEKKHGNDNKTRSIKKKRVLDRQT